MVARIAVRSSRLIAVPDCAPYLMELPAKIKPDIIVCLGSTAARAVIGKQHRVLKDRGRFFEHPMARSVTATIPSPGSPKIVSTPQSCNESIRTSDAVVDAMISISRYHS
jgi:uracil-DNA glycosylase family 4